MGESGKGNGKVKVGDNVLPFNLLPYLAEAYMQSTLCVSKITAALACEICPGFMFLSVLVGMLPSSEWFLMFLLSC